MTNHVLPDTTDLHILDALQDDIPLVSRPFAAIARRLGIPEQVLLERLKRLQDEGIVRGISPILESRHMGLAAATLIALHVPDERVHEIAAIISSYPEVSHNFRRDHYYALWFTLSGKNEEDYPARPGRNPAADRYSGYGCPEPSHGKKTESRCAFFISER